MDNIFFASFRWQLTAMWLIKQWETVYASRLDNHFTPSIFGKQRLNFTFEDNTWVLRQLPLGRDPHGVSYDPVQIVYAWVAGGEHSKRSYRKNRMKVWHKFSLCKDKLYIIFRCTLNWIKYFSWPMHYLYRYGPWGCSHSSSKGYGDLIPPKIRLILNMAGPRSPILDILPVTEAGVEDAVHSVAMTPGSVYNTAFFWASQIWTIFPAWC